MKARGVLATASIIAIAMAVATGFTGCGSDDPLGQAGLAPDGSPLAPGQTPAPVEPGHITGEFAGAGASSQESAMDAWIAAFQGLNPAVTVNYDPSGSGAGREQFLAGGAVWAGSDAVLTDEELSRSHAHCGPQGAIDLPIYISPIAIAFNLPGIESLNLTPQAIASIFTREITNWSDPAIAATNPGVNLPNLQITAVHRTDNSGTTENFAEYLHATAPTIWRWDPAGKWPLQGGDSAQGTSGVVGVVNDTVGAVTYVDASRAGALATAHLLVGENWVAVSPAAAAAAVDASPLLTGRHEMDLAINIDRASTAPGVYPLVLVSYAVACLEYPQVDGEFVQEFLGFIASPAGQALAARAAGSAPISASLEQQIAASLAAITLGGGQ